MCHVDSFVETFARYVGPFGILSLVIDFYYKYMGTVKHVPKTSIMAEGAIFFANSKCAEERLVSIPLAVI